MKRTILLLIIVFLPVSGLIAETLILETRNMGFAFQEEEYQVAEMRFYQKGNPVPNDPKGDKLQLVGIKFGFMDNVYDVGVQAFERNRLELDIYNDKKSGPLNAPIGHLSLVTPDMRTFDGMLQIFPDAKDGKDEKKGSGQFRIYMNLMPEPGQYLDLKAKEPKDEKWHKDIQTSQPITIK